MPFSIRTAFVLTALLEFVGSVLFFPALWLPASGVIELYGLRVAPLVPIAQAVGASCILIGLMIAVATFLALRRL